jgi:iron complex transport system substrate-binding protein
MDAQLLQQLRPDVILTQEICNVCAIDGRSVFAVAAKALTNNPHIVSINAARLGDILRNILDIGQAVGEEQGAERLVAAMRGRLDHVQHSVAAASSRPRVAGIEWVRTLRNAGLWMPEVIALAGGADVLGLAGERSRVLTADEFAASEPEVALVMPCGMDTAASLEEAKRLAAIPSVASTPAVRARQLYAIDGRMPSRHGPRIVDVAETVAALLHPELGLEPGPLAEWARVLRER